MRHTANTTSLFSTVRTEGGLLPADILAKIVTAENSVPGMTPEAYHLPKGEKINEAINRAWVRMRSLWEKFRQQRADLNATDTGMTITRETLLLPLFMELGYGRLLLASAEERTIGDKLFSLSHFWHHSPIHLLGCGLDLDRRAKGVRGAAQSSPHSAVQDFLNRSEAHLWGFCSNGLRLRILRDNVSFSRQAFIEFDLESMFEGEVFSDFVLLWLLCHQSRVECDSKTGPASCWLEQWARSAQEQGVRALDTLRTSVQNAIAILGQGFLESHNTALKERLRTGELSRQDYFRQLLRLVYRLLFLFAAEDRNLLHAPHTPEQASQRYAKWYSTARLRRLAGIHAGTKHVDMYEGLKCVMGYLGSEHGCPELGLLPLGSFLWSEGALFDVSKAKLSNYHLLKALRTLAYTETQGLRRPVDYKNVGARELGSIYESLLELHPRLDAGSGFFTLESASGNERKTTGSYYTPTSLIENLLDSALEPVIKQALTQEYPEQALLALTICDPACGSGHFLIAAAHRMAKRLAALRTGDEEPGPDATRKALRDVIGRCIYGVDINPMAVELCKVSLWMEALEPGKPLSFLDHHIRCGNSLIGATPELIASGLPDDAFKPISGDDKAACTALKKLNTSVKKEAALPMLAHQQRITQDIVRAAAAAVEVLPSDSLNDIRSKEAAFLALQQTTEFQEKRTLADMWCAAFVMRKYFPPREDNPTLLSDTPFGITQRHINNFAIDQGVKEDVRQEAQQLAEQYQFFHWHLAFPEVFAQGGFDVMLGNPPWERVKLQEKEWFAERSPTIANAPNAAARKKMIDALKKTDSDLHNAFQADLRKAEGESHFMRSSARFPLCGRGDINVYTVFAEAARSLVNESGRMGIIVPSGIASDDTTKFFFQNMVETQSLVSLFDFENKNIFPNVHSSYKFCLLTCGNGAKPIARQAEFVFFAHSTDALRDPERRFSLSSKDIALLNPNTRTCPIFRSRQDAELTKAIYRRVPVLIREAQDGKPEENPWGIKFNRMFDMSNDSHLFRTKEQLESEGWTLKGNVFTKLEYFTRDDGTPDASLKKFLPLYEAKMIHHFNHRWATYDGVDVRDTTLEERQDTDFVVLPRYWVDETNVWAKLDATGWRHEWLLGWRDITNSTNERTVVGGIFSISAVGNNLPVWTTTSNSAGHLSALLISFACDFVARFKVGGTHLNFFIAEQIAVLPPSIFETKCAWGQSDSINALLLPRILELTYTATDMAPFAKDCGYDGPPFRWDEERRFLLRAELDAAFFHLYLPANSDGTWKKADAETETEFQALCAAFPTPRHAVDYIIETFPIVKRKDEAAHGEYRTKRVILEVYDAMQEAMRTGTAYNTRLMPPPVELAQVSVDAAQSEQKVVYTPSPVMFPFGQRETRLTQCITALMRDDPGRGFDEYFDAMLLATNPENCAALLPAHRQAGFAQVLVATGFDSWSFPATDKVRYQKLKTYLKQRQVFIGAGNGLCSLPANFDHKNAPSMKALAPYLFEALQVTKQASAADNSSIQAVVTNWKQNRALCVIDTEEVAA